MKTKEEIKQWIRDNKELMLDINKKEMKFTINKLKNQIDVLEWVLK